MTGPTPETIAEDQRHAQTSRDLVRALGNGDELGATRIIAELSAQDTVGVLIQTGHIALTLNRANPGMTVDQMCDRLDLGR